MIQRVVGADGLLGDGSDIRGGCLTGAGRQAFTEIFPPGHKFHGMLKRADPDEVRWELARASTGECVDICTIWGTPGFVGALDANLARQREVYRPDRKITLDATGCRTETLGNLRFHHVGLMLADSRQNNTVILLNDRNLGIEADPGIIRWYQDSGFVSRVAFVSNAADLKRHCVLNGVKVYACDDYGEGFSSHQVNSMQEFNFVNNKLSVASLAAEKNRPFQIRFCFQSVKSEVTKQGFEELKGAHPKAFLKLCNIEQGGEGVIAVSDYEEFLAVCGQQQLAAERYGLNSTAYLQRAIPGVQQSFQLFFKPNDNVVRIVGLNTELVDPETHQNLGNRMVPVNADSITDDIGEMIISFAENLKKLCPNAHGFVMCDFRYDDDAKAYKVIDPGMRVTASTCAGLVQLYAQRDAADGTCPYVTNYVPGLPKLPGVDFNTVRRALGDLVDFNKVKSEGLGLIPSSWVAQHGAGRVIVVAPSEEDFNAVVLDIRARMTRLAN